MIIIHDIMRPTQRLDANYETPEGFSCITKEVISSSSK